MTTTPTVSWWKRLLCWWRGHTFRAPDMENYSGTILHLISEQSCVRCRASYVDLWNRGDFR